MAFRHGKFAEVTINGTALSTFFDSLDFNVNIDTADTTTFTKTWKTAITGLAGATLDLGGNYDPTVTTGPWAVLMPLIGADPFAVVCYPGGNLTNQISATLSCILTSLKPGSSVGDKVTLEASFLVTGVPTFATI